MKKLTVSQSKQRYPKADWRYEVANNDTQLGYNEWVTHKAESDGYTIKEDTDKEIKLLKKVLKGHIKENEERIREYVNNGGSDHQYLDGKAAAYTEILALLTTDLDEPQQLSASQIATILFSLRYLEQTYDSSGYIHSDHLQGLEPMNQLEINRLCEDINLNRISL
jgi:hypothetical protein